jgi:RHS repeat-associated protein
LTQTVGGLTTRYALDLAASLGYGLTQVLGDGTSKYLYGLGRIGQDGPGGWAYSLGDALGSVRQLTDAAGVVTLGRDFEPFGGGMASAGYGTTTFGFAGEQQDPTGLIFLRARTYEPATGRFLTKDPFPGLAALPTTLHSYQCALNNPVNLVDPGGQNPLLIAAGIGGLIGGEWPAPGAS